MLKEFNYQNVRVFYSFDGTGMPVILLHGLSEDISIWDSTAKRLSYRFSVLCLHLPGNGKSGCPANLTIDYLAEVVNALMALEGIEKAVLVGHSMGGYVALAVADKFPDRLQGLCLFHSFASADDEAKRAARDRSIAFIKENGRADYIRAMFIGLFGEQYKSNNPGGAAKMIRTAQTSTNDEGLIATIQAIKDRPDRTEVLRNIKVPVLFIAGKKDTAIPFEKLQPQMLLPHNAESVVLSEVNHMGMLESYAETSQAIINFSEKCFTQVSENS